MKLPAGKRNIPFNRSTAVIPVIAALSSVLLTTDGTASWAQNAPAGGGGGTPGTTPGTPGTNPQGPQGTPQTPTTPAPGVPQTPTAPQQNTPGQTPALTPGIVPSGSAAAQNPAGAANASPQFDLSRTISAALAASSALQTARRNVEIDRRRADEIAAEGRPNITGTGSATRFDQATKIAIGGGPAITVLKEHTEQLTLGISQRLDFTGQIRAATNQARLQSLADQIDLQRITNERALRSNTIYYNLLRAQHQVQVGEAALRSARVQQDIARKLYEGQVGQKIDLLRANTNVAQAEQEVQRAANNRDVARASFNDLVGRPLDAPVELTDVPGVTVGTDIAPATDANAPVIGNAASPFTPFAPPLADVDAIRVNESIAQAQRQRAEIQQGEILVRSVETGIKLARAGQEPSFSLSASGNYFPTTSFQAPRQRTAGITAAITIPFYDGGATRDRIAEARLRTENARTNLESAKSGVALEVQQAYLNLSTAARQITAANAALEQAVAARQLAQVRYAGQVGLFLEVTDAEAALVRAENNQVDAVYSYLTARAQYENALGTIAANISIPPQHP